MKISRRLAIGAGAGAAVIGAGALGVEYANRETPEPPAPPATDAQGHVVWRNWSGIRYSYPQLRAAPATEDEMAQILKTAPAPIRVVGAGHSFMPLVPTSGTLVSLDALAGLVDVDGERATAWAGTRLGDLGPALAGKGRAMANLPDINKQSIGGALGTATHGTGKHLPALHGDVTALRLATVDGNILECSAEKNADIFNAARVSLGSLGTITQVQLTTIPNKRLHRRVWLESFDDTLSKARPRGPETDSQFLDLLKTLRNLFGFSNTMRKAAARVLLASAEANPEEAVDEGWKLLSTERPIRFNEMEFHLPAAAQLAALREVVDTIEAKRPDVFFPIEARRIAPDDAWLSPFQGGPRGSIAVHTYYKDDYEFMFRVVQPILRRHGGRPHWGKLNSLTGADFASLYPRWNDFLALRRRLDPQGRLLNDYLKGIFGV